MENVKPQKGTNLESGSILKNILLFALPYLILNLLQNLFHTTDIAILGIMVDDEAVAAVGAISSLNNLLINFFVGLSVGVQAVLAKHIAAKQEKDAKRTVGASIFFSLFAGVVILLCAYPFVEDILILMSCAPELIPLAAKYLKIYLLGMPIMMLYNFSAAILRDNFQLIRCLVIGCLLNVGLDWLFVWLGYGVEGVAVATMIAQFVSAALIVIELFKSQNYYGLRIRYFNFNFKHLKEILYTGLPVAIRSLIFGFATVIMQVYINKLGALEMSGSTVAQQFDAIIYDVGNAIAVATMIVIGQGVVEKKMSAVKRSIVIGGIVAFCCTALLGAIFTIYARQLCGFIVDEKEVVDFAIKRLSIMSLTYFMCAISEVLSYSVQALGMSKESLKVSVFGECILRLALLFLAVNFFPDKFLGIFLVYPISWFVTLLAHLAKVPPAFSWLAKQMESNESAEEVIKEIQEDIEIVIMEN